MNIVVLGAGRVGFNVAKELSLSDNDVSIIDISKTALAQVSERLDAKPVFGHASDISVLKEAGIENADIVVAATAVDEINMTVCQIADFMFNVPTKIARIGKKSYFDGYNLFANERFPIDFVVSPALEVTKMVRRIISVPGTIDVISCIDGRLRIIGVICKKGSPITDIQLKYIQNVDTKSILAILIIKRADQWIIPNKNDIVHPGDEIYFACSAANIREAMALFDYSIDNTSNVVFIGGNEICEEVITNITSNDISIKIIENDLTRAEKLSDTLNNVEILHGDPLDSETLATSGIRDAEVVIAVTNDDKINILSSLLSKKLGAKRVATILNDSSYADILYSLGINSILDSRMATVSRILQYIHEESVENILSFDDARIEILAFNVSEGSYAVGTLTDDITIKNEAYIPAIVRNDQLFMMPKHFLLNAGDQVLFVTRKSATDKILKIFREKPKYLL